MKSKLLFEGLYKARFAGTVDHPRGHLARWDLEEYDQQVFDHIFTQKKENLYENHSIGNMATLLIKQIFLSGKGNDHIINNITYIFWEKKKMETKAAEGLIESVREIVKEELFKQRNTSDNYDRAGMTWSGKEDKQLIDEIALAVRTIAAIHRRSYGGITSRMQQLIQNGELRI